MTARVFVDTNVLVYQLDSRELEKQARAQAWLAAARVADCSYLLTENLQHDQDLDGLRVIDPFRVAPGDWS